MDPDLTNPFVMILGQDFSFVQGAIIWSAVAKGWKEDACHALFRLHRQWLWVIVCRLTAPLVVTGVVLVIIVSQISKNGTSSPTRGDILQVHQKSGQSLSPII
jgi:hypothetical protein